MILFVEDVLLEEIGRRILRELNPNAHVDAVMGKQGFDHFTKRVPEIRRSARGIKFLILLDADCLKESCPANFIFDYFEAIKPANVYVRFAVLEAENWLVADRAGLADFLRVPLNRISNSNDELQNAKEHIVHVARNSRSRDIKLDIAPARNHSSTVGPAYNARLSEFVRDHWNLDEARQNSDSLHRACSEIALADFSHLE